jgi:hypothetical protein
MPLTSTRTGIDSRFAKCRYCSIAPAARRAARERAKAVYRKSMGAMLAVAAQSSHRGHP